MAHTDACKIQVTEFVKKLVDNGIPVKTACQETEKHSDGIPAETVRRWWYSINKDTTAGVFKNEHSSTPPNNTEKPQLEKLEKKSHGGARKGSGRKSNQAAAMEKEGLEYNNRRKPRTKKEIEEGKKVASDASEFAVMAIAQLERIMKDDPFKDDAYKKVILWCESKLKGE